MVALLGIYLLVVAQFGSLKLLVSAPVPDARRHRHRPSC
jgi:hypothetical protein